MQWLWHAESMSTSVMCPADMPWLGYRYTQRLLHKDCGVLRPRPVAYGQEQPGPFTLNLLLCAPKCEKAWEVLV